MHAHVKRNRESAGTSKVRGTSKVGISPRPSSVLAIEHRPGFVELLGVHSG
jgi:hypothetical protein